jgi:hypothetical protein
MYFSTKNYLKSNHYHTAKHPLKIIVHKSLPFHILNLQSEFFFLF